MWTRTFFLVGHGLNPIKYVYPYMLYSSIHTAYTHNMFNIFNSNNSIQQYAHIHPNSVVITILRKRWFKVAIM